MATLKVPRKWPLRVYNNYNAHTGDVKLNVKLVMVCRKMYFKNHQFSPKFVDRLFFFCTEIVGIDPLTILTIIAISEY